MSNRQNALGVLMLDTRFQRPPGDVGNPRSWDCPVVFRRISGAFPAQVVRQDATTLIPAFVAAAEDLVQEGATAIITSCGFMARYQKEIAAQISVPFGASSLMQLPVLAQTLGPDKVPGVITYDAESLQPDDLAAVGANPFTPVAGLPKNGAFHALIEQGKPYDRQAMEREIHMAVRDLLERHPQIGAIVLECTNMPPFSYSLRRAFSLPVQDILTLGHWLYHTTSPRQMPDA